ncbi:Coiled-coil domain-containing protein 96 [Thoreauomyces humboldtii]|nr:Coiled-coil domain-containing protein 96 [Thoreauomyces humboldtii]
MPLPPSAGAAAPEQSTSEPQQPASPAPVESVSEATSATPTTAAANVPDAVPDPQAQEGGPTGDQKTESAATGGTAAQEESGDGVPNEGAVTTAAGGDPGDSGPIAGDGQDATAATANLNEDGTTVDPSTTTITNPSDASETNGTDGELREKDDLSASLDRFPTVRTPSPEPEPELMPQQSFLPATTRTLTSPPPAATYAFVNVDADGEDEDRGVDVGCVHGDGDRDADAEVDVDDASHADAHTDAHDEKRRKANKKGVGVYTLLDLTRLRATSPTEVQVSVDEDASATDAAAASGAAAGAGSAATSAAATTVPPATGGKDREELIAGIKAALDGKERLKARNTALQNALGEYFRRKRTDEPREATESKGGSDVVGRYRSALSSLMALTASQRAQAQVHGRARREYEGRLSQKRAEAGGKGGEFRAYKREIAGAAENSRSGKPVPPKIVDALEAAEERKDAEVVDVRLGYIKLRNRLRRCEGLLRQKEELADGLHLIDFEQLKIENSTYTSKIEARNEDLLKLRKKITTIVQVLTHVKEKLHHTAGEARVLANELRTCDADVLKWRDAMPAAKKGRDAVRKDNVRLDRRAGLLGEDGLLRDFEERVDQTAALENEIQILQARHGAHAQEILAVKRKIRKTQILAGVADSAVHDEELLAGREVGW